MAQIAISSLPLTLSLELGEALRLSDEELLRVCARNPELRIERTAQGDLIVLPPAGGASGHRNLEITSALAVWARRDATGAGFDSSTGFLPLCPDFVVELRSPSDRLPDLQAKMEEYRENGARLGWLIDPLERRVHVYRPTRTVEVLNDPATVAGDPELAGLVLELEPIWRPL